MCGRFSNRWTSDEWMVHMPDVDWAHSVHWDRPRLNVAPGEAVWVREPSNTVQSMRWGWTPSWLKGRPLINARVETLTDRPAFRPFLHQRGLVLADAFYEWKKTPNRRSEPHRIALESGEPLLLAALWARQPSGETAVVILTEEADAAMAPIHSRQPVAVPLAAVPRWLDPGFQPWEMWPAGVSRMESWRIEPIAPESLRPGE